jgi:hypothetical protein
MPKAYSGWEPPLVPYADVTETADRRWTSRLLDRLVAPSLPDEEMEDLVGALQAASDPRTVGPLEAIVCDAARPADVRRAASSALRGLPYLVPDVPDAKLRRWWREGDTVLRRHALLSMDGIDCPDMVLWVAQEPGLSVLVQTELGHPADEVDLFVMDEIGKMELLCPKFVRAVPRLLKGPVPVVATVAVRGGGLIAEVKARPDVRLVEVTSGNRDGLPEEVERWVRERRTGGRPS